MGITFQSLEIHNRQQFTYSTTLLLSRFYVHGITWMTYASFRDITSRIRMSLVRSLHQISYCQDAKGMWEKKSLRLEPSGSECECILGDIREWAWAFCVGGRVRERKRVCKGSTGEWEVLFCVWLLVRWLGLLCWRDRSDWKGIMNVVWVFRTIRRRGVGGSNQ